MNLPAIIKWAKKEKQDIDDRKIRYESKYVPDMWAHFKMIVEQGEIIQTETIRLNRYMEQIKASIKYLEEHEAKSPVELEEKPKDILQNVSPLKR